MVKTAAAAVVLLLTAIAGCSATSEHFVQETQPQAFAVQTGYEGFLVPSEVQPLLPLPGALAPLTALLGFKALASAGLWLFGLVLVVLTGAGLASAVCAFTPLCTLGLAFGRQNSDKLHILTTFVHNALDKYNRLQKTK